MWVLLGAAGVCMHTHTHTHTHTRTHTHAHTHLSLADKNTHRQFTAGAAEGGRGQDRAHDHGTNSQKVLSTV